MKSPFPGMDPYLEARWSDVHTKLISFMGEEIQRRVPLALRARVALRLPCDDEDEDDGEEEIPQRYSDIGGTAVASAGQVPRWPPNDRIIQIIDLTSGNRVVTAIEILMPSSKAPGPENEAYLRWLNQCMTDEVCVVEIDLLRHPSRGRLPVRMADIPRSHRTPYLTCIRRGWQPDQWETYPISLGQSLPCIAIPLRQSDDDLALDLQPLIERIYIAGGHDDIDYSKPTDPPLAGDDAKWADELLRAAGKRA